MLGSSGLAKVAPLTSEASISPESSGVGSIGSEQDGAENPEALHEECATRDSALDIQPAASKARRESMQPAVGAYSGCARLVIYYDAANNILQDPGPYRVHHNSEFRKVWDITTCAVLAYMCGAFPVQLAFDLKSIGFRVMDETMNVFFIFDLALNFVTTFEDDERNLVVNAKSIAITYLKSWFAVDLVSSVPVEYLFPGSGSNSLFRAVKMLKLIKLMRVLRLGRLVARAQESFGLKNSSVMIMKFTFMLMLSAHWLGCLYYFFTSMDTGKDTWLKNYLDGTSGGAIGDRGNGEIYLAVLYWALTTMSTIGYGDIIPVSTTERVITSFAMILGSCIFAYGLTNVCFLVYNYNRYQVTYETSMDEFSEYFERQRVPPELVRRIQTFFWFTHYSSNVEDDPELENRLFSVLPPGLRRDLKMHVSENGINTSTADMRNHPMLYFTRKHCAEQRVDFELAKLMEGAVFTPEDQVVLGATGRVCPAVSILLKGMLVLTHCDPAQGAVSCGPGTSFGEVSIVMDRPMMGKDFLVATPDRFVEVQVLNRAPLVALLTEHWSLNAALQKLYSVPAHQRDYFQYEDILLLKEYIDTHEDDFSSQIMAPAIPSADPSVRRMQRTDRIAELTQLMEDKKLQLSDLKAELARLQFLEQEHVQITAAASQSGQAAPH